MASALRAPTGADGREVGVALHRLSVEASLDACRPPHVAAVHVTKLDSVDSTAGHVHACEVIDVELSRAEVVHGGHVQPEAAVVAQADLELTIRAVVPPTSGLHREREPPDAIGKVRSVGRGLGGIGTRVFVVVEGRKLGGGLVPPSGLGVRRVIVVVSMRGVRGLGV